jgi:hypothetical protein
VPLQLRENHLRPLYANLPRRGNLLRLPRVRLLRRGNHLRSPYAQRPLREKLSRPLQAALALRGKHLRSPQVNIPLCNSHYRLGLPVLGRREPGQRRQPGPHKLRESHE